MTPAPAPFPLHCDLVLIGGGHAHALVLRMWGMNPLPGTRLTVINPGPTAPYTGMLPGHIAGHYGRDDLMIDLVRLARFAGARLILDAATGIDRAAKLIHLKDRPPLRYDTASLDVGITSDLPELPGFAEHALSAKPLGAYAERWNAFVARGLVAPKLVILGGGIGGIELAMASAYRLRAMGAVPDITVIERNSAILPNIGRGARRALIDAAQKMGIRILTGTSASAVRADSVTLTSGQTVPSDFTLSVAGARAHDWFQATGLGLSDGYIATGPTLQSADPAIFAVGDCARMPDAPRPKAGVFAVRAAPVLFHNLRAALSGGAMRRYRPQRDYLKLVSTGGQTAVADKFGLRLSGARLWRLKDRIDRRFMAKFEDYPAMPRPLLPREATAGLASALGAQPLCAGCGAKLGPAVLGRALAALPKPDQIDVLSGPGDDAAILATPDGVQLLTTDHLRSFTNDPRLMARVTALHALGDVWAMGATPQVALSQIILPPLGPALQADMLAEIMAAASEVFRAAGADIVGGHTSQGAELTIGFTVTGTARRPILKGGAVAGDALILTKPIGSGTVLAAEMAMVRLPGLSLGETVAACHTMMQRPLGPAAALLAGAAHAMTDVTGFGLAGHLLEMLAASSVAATLRLADVPFVAGAEALAAAGHGSSLAPDNRAATSWRMTAVESPRLALLFDPQTAGGLLAAVPADRAEALVAALRAAGETVAIVGEVTAGAPHLTVLS